MLLRKLKMKNNKNGFLVLYSVRATPRGVKFEKMKKKLKKNWKKTKFEKLFFFHFNHFICQKYIHMYMDG